LVFQRTNPQRTVEPMSATDASPRILFAEDDPGVREALARALRFEGYEVQTASDGGEALEYVGQNPPDLLVLDVMMPFVDGLSVCRRVREKHRQLPILMLTARQEISDRVAGLDAGADDYLAKPFALDELLARIRALLRRTMASGNEQSISAVGLFLDPARRVATRDGVDLDLTKTEFDLLDLLMTNAGIVLSREVLYERIWGFDFETSSKSLDVYIGYLRRKTEESNPSRLIHTVRGVGYVLRAS
jgi:two-component system, OmpR family, response regulator MprA